MRIPFLVGFLILASGVQGFAQSPPVSGGAQPPINPVEKPDTRGEVPGVTVPAPGQAAVPEVAPDPKATIPPSNVDPKMAIPAPGTPGGNPAVNPK